MDKNKILEAAAKLVAKGAYDKAIKEYQKVLEADPKDVRVLQKMGELHQKKNDNPQAAHYFTKVAESYSADGFFLKAVALYKQVLKLNPNLLEVNLKLAELHQQLGLMGEAMAYFQIVANAYDKAGDIKNSLDTLRRMVDLDPDNVGSRKKLAELYARENMTREAVQEFKRAAEYLKRNNRTDEWLAVAERAATLEPENHELAKELAQLYLSRGDQKRALARLQVVFKSDSRDLETLNLLAQAFQGLGQTSKTISVYKELAKVHQDRGRAQEAQAVWDRIAVLDPHDPDLQARRAHQPSSTSAAPAANHAPAPAPEPAPAAQPARTHTPQPAAPAEHQPVGMTKEQLSKLLTETDVYVKYGLHDKALEHLRKIFGVDPENLDAHEKAYHIYVASNNPAQAFEQLLNVLRLCTRNAEVQRAQPYLATILQQSPGHPEVPAFLEVLRTDDPGMAAAAPVEAEALPEDAILVDSSEDEVFVAPAPEDALAQPPGDDLALVTASMPADEELVDDEAALVSSEAYGDLGGHGYSEEVVADDGMAAAPFDSNPVEDEPLTPAPGFGTPMGLDEDPPPTRVAPMPLPLGLGEEDEPPPTRVAIPSAELFKQAFPARPAAAKPGGQDPFAHALAAAQAQMEDMESSEATIPIPLPREATAQPAQPPPPPARPTPPVPAAVRPAASAGKPAGKPAAAPPPPKPAPVAPPPVEEEEPAAEECEEASFFIDQGILDEARDILENVLIAFPSHERATELMARLEELEAQGGPAPKESAPATVPTVPSVQPVGEEKDAFDLAAELAGEFEELGGNESTSPIAQQEEQQISVEQVFAEFKKGLAKVVKPEDVDTHYDLGIAYKEMGLIDDALGEFSVARDGCMGKKREVDCLMMMGLIQVERGLPLEAVGLFKQALASEHAVGEAAKALGYELASAYEALSEYGRALYHYQRVAATDARYRDVSAHVSRLAASTAPVEDPLPTYRNGAPSADSRPPASGMPPAPAGAAKARKVGYV
jgi:pilus assembly protein FimV